MTASARLFSIIGDGLALGRSTYEIMIYRRKIIPRIREIHRKPGGSLSGVAELETGTTPVVDLCGGRMPGKSQFHVSAIGTRCITSNNSFRPFHEGTTVTHRANQRPVKQRRATSWTSPTPRLWEMQRLFDANERPVLGVTSPVRCIKRTPKCRQKIHRSASIRNSIISFHDC